MARSVRQSPTVYLGLFVVFFALYASEHQKLAASLKRGAPLAEKVSAPEERVSYSVTKKIQDLTHDLQSDSLFAAHADGLKAVYRFDSVTVSFAGDEVYEEGGFAFRETWYTALDRLATLIKPYLNLGLKIAIIGNTDVGSPAERKPSDYGDSDYALSFARAEWVGRFLERRALIAIKERVQLTGAGATQQGRRVDLKFTF